MVSDEELRARVRKIARKSEFYAHLGIYRAVSAFPIALWQATGSGFPWFVLLLID
jgi:hypothetical protein